MIKLYDGIGEIEMIPNTRAKSVIVRYKEGRFRLTHPSAMHISDIDAIVEKMRLRIIGIKEKASQQTHFTTNKTFRTYTFNFAIKEEDRADIQFLLKAGTLYLLCPRGTDFESKEMQTRIKNTITQVMRNEAKRILPEWVKRLAALHEFKYKAIKINSSRTRWGSCSSLGNINLSLYCLLLPENLIELIILHELCHTIEMNHSSRFWNLLDKVTDGNAARLTTELKTFRTSF